MPNERPTSSEPFDSEPPVIEKWAISSIGPYMRVSGLLNGKGSWKISGRLKKINIAKNLVVTEEGRVYRLGERAKGYSFTVPLSGIEHE